MTAAGLALYAHIDGDNEWHQVHPGQPDYTLCGGLVVSVPDVQPVHPILHDVCRKALFGGVPVKKPRPLPPVQCPWCGGMVQRRYGKVVRHGVWRVQRNRTTGEPVLYESQQECLGSGRRVDGAA